MQKLFDAVASYLDVARAVFHQLQSQAKPQAAIQVLWSPAQLQRQAALAAEQSPEFSVLVESVTARFGSNHKFMTCEGETEKALISFFCHSGTYTSLFSPVGGVDPRRTTDELQRAFSANTHHVTYLAPLEYVSFEVNIDCGHYRIQRFSVQELDVLLENKLRQVFYPDLYVDTAALEPYWFIVADGTESHPLCVDPCCDEFEDVLKVKFSPYPEMLERALRQFAVFSWDRHVSLSNCPRYLTEGYFSEEILLKPHIPFFIEISDSPVVAPGDPPNMHFLNIPRPGSLDEMELSAQSPWLDESLTRDFERLMRHIGQLVTAVNSHAKQWPFIELAMGFLLKGFLTEGLESLLWSITSIEALLGERRDSLTDLIAGRTAKALGSTKNERKKIRELFKQLYDRRSGLVHADQRLINSKVLRADAIQARDLACALVLWMLGFLAEVAGRWKPSFGPLPTREHLLKVLDLASERDLFVNLLGTLPTDFPGVHAWLDPGNLIERWRADHRKKHPELYDLKKLRQEARELWPDLE